jgi:hypothetical protein
MFSLWQPVFWGFLQCSIILASGWCSAFFAFKVTSAATAGCCGEGLVKVKVYFGSFALVRVVFRLVLLSDVGLAFEVIVLALLILGLAFRLRKHVRRHGLVMLGAVVVHAVGVFGIMVPSFFLFLGSVDLSIWDVWQTLSLVHGVLGVLVLLLGVWLAASWRLQTDLGGCFKRKKIMLITLAGWLVLVALGLVLWLRISLLI